MSKLNGTDDEKWTICGSLCTVADLIVKNLPIGTPECNDKIIFYNIGAYSITEGIYLFLSRKMPVITACNKDGSVEVYRDVICSDRINIHMLYFVSDRIPVFSEGRVLNCSCLIL